MKPIRYRADVEYHQALRCVEYRLPKQDGLRPNGYLLALGLRYGLLGMAASHHLAMNVDIGERHELMAAMKEWPRAVEMHVRQEIAHRLPFSTGPNVAGLLADLAAPIGREYLSKCRCLKGLDEALRDSAADFLVVHRPALVDEWPWFKRRSAVREFGRRTAESISFAINFYERRQLDLEEVAAIALLGE